MREASYFSLGSAARDTGVRGLNALGAGPKASVIDNIDNNADKRKIDLYSCIVWYGYERFTDLDHQLSGLLRV